MRGQVLFYHYALTNKEIMRLSRFMLIVLSFSNFSKSGLKMVAATCFWTAFHQANIMSPYYLIGKRGSGNVSGEFSEENTEISYIGIRNLFLSLYR